ncbi:MAG: 3-phosphoshikimate 1-carboxyvinyltransferase [Anaerolineae bacterium]|nr:3-phosphoshikimate 1-carboxyvinyltransferase [Anaerolineae bacterium]
MLIQTITHPLHASVRVPGSKSLTNRALLIAALADGTTRLENALFSDDSRYFAAALQTLGFGIRLDEASQTMTVSGLGGRIPASHAELFIGNAGTAARFLSAFLTLGSGQYTLDGEPRMRERPIGDLVETLEALGAVIQPLNQPITNRKSICPPITIHASGLPGGQASIAGDISSQFLSALLMVAPYAKNPVELTLSTELNSKPYIEMTLAVMQEFGLSVERRGYEQFTVRAGRYQPREGYIVESDASAASYFFAAPLICGGRVCVENIRRQSKQGDIAFLDVLRQMGAEIRLGSDSVTVTGSAPLRGLDVDMRDIPDTAQTLAAIAPFASSPTRIRGIASARVKETDRVAATCTELTRLGVTVEEHPDGMTIHPCQDIRPAKIQTYNDHRMAMAFSLIGLRAPGIEIENPGCVSKTFPNYFDVLEQMKREK